MATIRKDIPLNAPPDQVWDVIRVWITDILPNTVVAAFTGMIEGGASVIQRTL
jgi:hypothetical protein